MKAIINNKLYNVNNGWELDLRGDEQFSSGTISLQLPFRNALSSYTYINLIESNDSYLEFTGIANTFPLIEVISDLFALYFDINLTALTTQILAIGNDTSITINNGSIKIASLTNDTYTNQVLTTGRHKIAITQIDGLYEIFVDGVQQEKFTDTSFISGLGLDDIGFGGTTTGFDLYDARLNDLAIDAATAKEVTSGERDVNVVFPYDDTRYIYTDFKANYKLATTNLIKNYGYATDGDLGFFQVNIIPVKEWFMFTQSPKSVWFDREDNTFIHTIPVVELIEWATTVKTPYMDLSNPLTGTPIFSGIQDMIEHIYNVAFPELQNVNRGLTYTQELLNAMVGVDAFDIEIEESNLYSAWARVFTKLNGYPTIAEIVNGQLQLGIKFKSKTNSNIEFNDYDDFEEFNPNKGYGAVGESRGINVVNNSEVDNKNAYAYTEDTAISFRSETLEINENNIVIDLLYPIEMIDSVIFYELDNPTNTVDLTPFVVLESKWRLLKSSGFTSGTTNLFKQNTIWYEKGQNTLNNFGGVYKRVLWFNNNAWQEIIKSAQTLAGVTVNVPAAFDDISVVVNYRTRNDNKLMRIAKEDISTVNRHSTLQTNQSGNIVNSKILGSVLHSDIQSSGNLITIYNKSAVESINDMYELNDYDLLTNSMIKAIKVNGFSESYSMVYTLSKDYQSITDNLDISAQVRQYNIPEGKPSLRYYEDYIEWNLEGLENNTSSLTADGIEAFMNTFGRPTSIVKKNVDNVEMISSEIIDENGVVQRLIVPIDTDGYRNTMEFHFGFDDPTFAYDKKITTTIGGSAVKIAQGVRYTDSNGHLDTLELNYGKKYTATDKVTIDSLPVADVTKFSGNPLIQFGTLSTYDLDWYQDTIYRLYNVGSSTVARSEDFAVPIVRPTSTTKSVTVVYNDLGTVTYAQLQVNIRVIDNLNNVIDLGTTAITEGVAQTIAINLTIKQIIVNLVANGSKDSTVAVPNEFDISYVEELLFTSNGLQLSLGINDILKHTYFLHNVFYKTTASDIGEIVIGDEAMINNMLVGGPSKTLYVYEHSTRYDKATEREFVKGTQIGLVGTWCTFGTRSITYNGVLPSGYGWAIGDSNGKLLFAVNQSRERNGVVLTAKQTVSFNFVHFRTGLIREY